MTFLTKSHHVIPIVCAAVGQFDLVVGKRSGREPSVVLAHHAQRIRRKERRTDLLPRPAIAFVALGIAVAAVISFGFLLGVCLAVAACREFSASAMGAGFLRFVWHLTFLHLGIIKGRSARERPSEFSCHYNYNRFSAWLSMVNSGESNRPRSKPYCAGGESTVYQGAK